MDITTLPFQKVLSEEESRNLETVDVYISDVEPKETSQVLKFIQENCPQSKTLCHVKRIKKTIHSDGKGFTLSVLICLTFSISINDLKLLIKKQNLDSILNPRVHQISKYPPITRAQFEEWKKLWPINFHEDLRREPNFTSEEIETLKSHMIRAIKLAEMAKSYGEIAVGCVIADSKNGRVLSESYDKRTSSKHPLRHATLNCIDELSIPERTSIPATSNFIIPNKRKAEDNDQTYLCKGYDIFVTHEPCIMCSMALVHSRVNRVFYGRSNNLSGGLGSCYKIHTHEALNHHFKTYKGFLEDQIEMLEIDC
ncbi:8266_t:CDS:2 [Diversispora eburnea]|uniref:8266_t:CDS:1 n=1 Tax=Diversispora eburnea TaxID=1213867 RepID=A0A9N8YPW0_9GLOM|nr:8266_t:CDS:2 [Diversispora eburnea]